MDDTVRQHKYTLTEDQMPTAWYNIIADLADPPPPPLHPGRRSRSARRTSPRCSRWT